MKRIVCIFFALVFLSSCASSFAMKKEEGGYYCRENGVKYMECSPALEAKYQGERFAAASERLVFYEVPGELHEHYLTTGYDCFSTVFRAENVAEYTLSDFEGARVLLCSETASGKISCDTIFDDDGKTYRLLLSLLEGEELEAPKGAAFSFSRSLRLESDRVRSFYYVFSLLVDTSGKVYLVDERSDRCVSAGEFFTEYLS